MNGNTEALSLHKSFIGLTGHGAKSPTDDHTSNAKKKASPQWGKYA